MKTILVCFFFISDHVELSTIIWKNWKVQSLFSPLNQFLAIKVYMYMYINVKNVECVLSII